MSLRGSGGASELLRNVVKSSLQLTKIKGLQSNEYHKYLLTNSEDIVICTLMNNHDDVNHAICIDLRTNSVYDSCEDKVMELTETTLNICNGVDSFCKVGSIMKLKDTKKK